MRDVWKAFLVISIIKFEISELQKKLKMYLSQNQFSTQMSFFFQKASCMQKYCFVLYMCSPDAPKTSKNWI